jgi:hypothetical protein
MSDDSELLSAAIEASGLSARRFATAIISRDERTVRRWIAGGTMPPVVREWLGHWNALSDSARTDVVRHLTREIPE